MSIQESIAPTNANSSLKMFRAMVGIGAICGLLIVLTYEGSLPRIEKNAAEALQKAIFNVVPSIAETQTFQLNEDETFGVLQDDKTNVKVYAGYDTNQALKGFAIETSGQGYADIIKILYGYDPQKQEITGIHVLESRETPGLGDKIEKDINFLANFTSLNVRLNEDQTDLINPIINVKNGTKQNSWEIDGITGATISSRAIGDMLAESTKYWIPLLYNSIGQFKYEEKQPAEE